MRLRDRIFDLVFADRRRRRKDAPDPAGTRSSRKDRGGGDGEEGFDARYFVQRHR